MVEVGSAPKNKIELESQVLSTALRQSWCQQDQQGAINSAQELYRLFPDLLAKGAAVTTLDNYKLLELDPRATATEVVVEYLCHVRSFLRKSNLKAQKEEFNRILDAGFILRKPRLRISHDLVSVRNWLIEIKAIDATETFKALSTESKIISPEPPPEPSSSKLPKIVMLLTEAQFIGDSETQALEAQLALAPEIPIERLILDSGYVSQPELNSLKLAELLLEQGKITMAQFQVAIYDERTSGVRMAESLQIRGWLPVEVRSGQQENKI